jgi:hypothetical protein
MLWNADVRATLATLGNIHQHGGSREFIEFLKHLDAAYPASIAIKLILDNHSAHISRETIRSPD